MRFSIGINYWPRRSAMHMWQRFDPGEIADDMGRLATLGFDSVRFFLRWADFQPEPHRMDRTMLARLERVMELIAAAGLRAMPTLFCGHMSGVNWLPSWTLDRAARRRALPHDHRKRRVAVRLRATSTAASCWRPSGFARARPAPRCAGIPRS